ncbi:uncharacterized protein LOC114308198 [Camellia sinensis]|uniref:uncharacterized protein LOC114308198 n=1 Tax=Camellia sinensis TaxID=4442 RepID=UPI00103551BB|nr:uncharacterized protein LOC114308198 [Camellia sinensis]
MKLLIWNCRGAGNKIFRRTLKELVQNYKPLILALMETKAELSAMGQFFNKLGFTASSHVDPVGRSGGIWILWDPFRATIKALEVNAQFIHAKIQRDNHSDWILSSIYVSPNPRVRDNLWENLEAAADNINHPWLMAGDFNDITSQGEKRSFSTNHSKWRLAFTEEAVKNLPQTYSDHSPMIVFTQGMNSPNPSARPFRLEATWFTDSSFKNVVEKSWADSHFSVPEAIDLVTKNALSWNKNIFGNIFRKKKWLLGRIEGIQKSQSRIYSHNLFLLEKELVKDYNTILYQEELLWFQKSEANWITQVERNTRFFHISTIARRRRMRVTTLKNMERGWISNPDDLCSHVLNYFCDLFKYDATVHTSFSPINLQPKFSNKDNIALSKHITNQDVWEAIKSIKAFKAPGSNGIQSIFYHTHWDIVGPLVCKFIQTCFVNQYIPENFKDTLITLIPKVNNPESINHFRPISLCNVLYKTLTKVLVSRLRPLLSSNVGPFQSNFIHGRTTCDNIIIAQEIVHTLRGKKGKTGDLILKIDLEKAYDNVS